MSYKERVFWNRRSYGDAVDLRKPVIAALIGLCLLTPATNWLIPFTLKVPRIIWRYD